ncbi:hypothetical protein TanjilG_17224 [Lupinus angustifolius]|uniref:Homeobox-leucine zipper protein n=2 Tax=Lupinus angustifolius TaxID=3871 RepID=A0A4P1R1R5_LUPAN|nr:hypothetical protein TanjilG_17224 [Lupinus angustifolius]
MEMKQQTVLVDETHEEEEKKGKKKRLTSVQVESLERGFQEGMKLEPDKKMKLSKELGLEPRQIAIWFQNRRARWKVNQLKHHFDVIMKENQKLHQEVMNLKAMMSDHASTRKQISASYAEICEEQTAESVSAMMHYQQNVIADQGNYSFTMQEYYNMIPMLQPYPAAFSNN